MTPQETVERALAAARCDDCVVIADETSQANLRWAANSLTTDGVVRSRRLTVIAITRGAGGRKAGVVSRAGVRADQVADVVAAAESAASQNSPAEDAQPLLGPGDPEAFGVKEGPEPGQPGWDDEPGSTGIGVFTTFSPRARRGVRSGEGGRAEAVRVCRALADQHLPRHLDRPAAAPRSAHG